VFPESAKERIEKREDNAYYVFVNAKTKSGMANKQALAVLRKKLKIDGQMRIVSGHHSPKKIIEVTVTKGD